MMMMMLCGLLLVALAAHFQDRFHLVEREHREEAREQQIQGEEDPDRTDEDAYIHPGGMEHGPAAWQVIAVQAGNDDHESLEPHTDVHDDAHEEGEHQIAAKVAEPEELRADHIARHHDPIRPQVRTS